MKAKFVCQVEMTPGIDGEVGINVAANWVYPGGHRQPCPDLARVVSCLRAAEQALMSQVNPTEAPNVITPQLGVVPGNGDRLPH